MNNTYVIFLYHILHTSNENGLIIEKDQIFPRYLNPSSVSPSIPFSDTNTTVQKQVHSNKLNFSSMAIAGLSSLTSIIDSTSSINKNETQPLNIPSSQMNESLQHTLPSSFNNTPDSTLNLPHNQKIFVENRNNVVLREKSSNNLFDARKTRKRFSEPIFDNQQKGYAHPVLQQQQLVQANHNLARDDLNNQILNYRCSFRCVKSPIIFPTIPQQVFKDEPQKLLIVRHAERVDSTFGTGWLNQVFDRRTGTYRRINLNFPKKMVIRRDLRDFLFDPPLTELGLHECKMVGEALAAQGVDIQHVYSSPALRCIQTADKILEGLQIRDKKPIRIEPCLFEFLKWYPVVPIKWPFLSLDELTENGYNVDKSYKPFYPIESLRKDEDELMYYQRSHFIITSILRNHEIDGGNLLIVGHVR